MGCKLCSQRNLEKVVNPSFTKEIITGNIENFNAKNKIVNKNLKLPDNQNDKLNIVEFSHEERREKRGSEVALDELNRIQNKYAPSEFLSYDTELDEVSPAPICLAQNSRKKVGHRNSPEFGDQFFNLTIKNKKIKNSKSHSELPSKKSDHKLIFVIEKTSKRIEKLEKLKKFTKKEKEEIVIERTNFLDLEKAGLKLDLTEKEKQSPLNEKSSVDNLHKQNLKESQKVGNYSFEELELVEDTNELEISRIDKDNTFFIPTINSHQELNPYNQPPIPHSQNVFDPNLSFEISKAPSPTGFENFNRTKNNLESREDLAIGMSISRIEHYNPDFTTEKSLDLKQSTDFLKKVNNVRRSSGKKPSLILKHLQDISEEVESSESDLEASQFLIEENNHSPEIHPQETSILQQNSRQRANIFVDRKKTKRRTFNLADYSELDSNLVAINEETESEDSSYYKNFQAPEPIKMFVKSKNKITNKEKSLNTGINTRVGSSTNGGSNLEFLSKQSAIKQENDKNYDFDNDFNASKIERESGHPRNESKIRLNSSPLLRHEQANISFSSNKGKKFSETSLFRKIILASKHGKVKKIVAGVDLLAKLKENRRKRKINRGNK